MDNRVWSRLADSEVIGVAMLDSSISRWKLIPDGDPIVTRNGHFLPVRAGGVPAMLKLATDAEERLGGVHVAELRGDRVGPMMRPRP